MYYPKLTETSQSRLTTDIFRGFNHNLRIEDGEWYDESNLTSSHYPLFSQREKRGIVKQLTAPTGLLAKDALMYADGGVLYYNDYPINGITLNSQPKTMVSMGAYAVIFPDKVYVNTQDLTDCGSIEAEYHAGGLTATYSMCRVDGEGYDVGEGAMSDTAPQNPVNGQYWIDTSDEVHVLKQYSTSSASWISIASTYIKIECPGIGLEISEGDGVTISGAPDELEINTDMLVYAADTDYIVVAGILSTVIEQANSTLMVERKCPDLDYVCESGNRLWGCHYGLQDGQVVNEIYACKLGDFKNWRCYAGLTTDSYAVTVGTDGKFTGAVTHQGYPLFFKSDCIHKIYGAYPAQYQVVTTMCRGVQDGSEKSLCIVNEILYYKSRVDVCAYDGSMPVNVSEALGTGKYYDAVAGAIGGKYYISMRDAQNAWGLYVYDTERGIWHREDDTQAMLFVNVRGDMMYVDAASKKLISATGMSGSLESDIQWMAESGLQGYEFVDQKYLSRYNIRAKLAQGATMSLALEYDSEGRWESAGTWSGDALTGTINIPVIPRRCDHLRLRITGTGDVKIYSISRMLEGGSDHSWHRL